MIRLPTAVVFDCDGTIADTESLSDRAWELTLASRGYQPTETDFRAVIGHPFARNWAYYSARVDLGDQVEFRAELRARFLALFDSELAFHADVVDTMRELAAHDVPLAVASSSNHGHVERVLRRGGLERIVDVVVGADDVGQHKPHPEPYLTAAAGLGVAASRCSAVEDTPVGVASAVAAGMFTVGVVRAHSDPAVLGEADRVVWEVSAPALVRGPGA